MSPCITPEPLLVFLDFFVCVIFFFWGGRRVPLHPHGAVLWGGIRESLRCCTFMAGQNGKHLWSPPLQTPLGLRSHPAQGWRIQDSGCGHAPPGPPSFSPSSTPGLWGGIPPVPPTPNPGSSPSPAQHRVALSYSYFCILLFLFSPFKPVQCSSRRSPPSPVKKIKIIIKKKAEKTAISALPTPHSPNAFMYSSKLAVSTSFQVPTNASTMAKPRVSPRPSVPAAPHRPQLPPGPAAP